MTIFTQVDHDPFAAPSASAGVRGRRVDHDPFKDAQTVNDSGKGDRQEVYKPKWADLPGNIVPSAVNAAKGVYDAVTHPVQTYNTLNDAATGAVLKIYEDTGLADLDKSLSPSWLPKSPNDLTGDRATMDRQKQTAEAVGTAFKDRYWGLENAKRTMITDPAGAALDIGTVMSGGATALGTVPLKATRAASSALHAASEAINPVSLAAKVAGKGVRAIKNNPYTSSPESYAARKIAQSAEREGLTVPDVQQNLRNLQQDAPDALVVDALGENGGRLARTVSNRGGKGAQELSQKVHARQASQNDRVNAQIGKSLGDPDSYHDTLDSAIQQLRTNAAPAYSKAYGVNIDYAKHGPSFTSVWNRVPPRLQKKVLDSANDILISEGKQPKQIGSVIGRNPNGTVTPLPDVEQWDYIKRGLDAVIEAENVQGAAGGMSAIGRSINGVKKDLVSLLDKAVPEYAQARKIYSDDLSVKNALELGRKSLNTDAELIRKTMTGLDVASKETFRIGYARAMADVINRMGLGGDAISRLWAAPARQARLKEVFGSKAEFDKFTRFAQGEEQMRRSYTALTGNSTTARQLSDMVDGGNDAVVDIVGKAASGNFVGATVSALTKSLKTIGGLTEAKADAIARILASPDLPPDIARRAVGYQAKPSNPVTAGRVNALYALGQTAQDQ